MQTAILLHCESRKRASGNFRIFCYNLCSCNIKVVGEQAVLDSSDDLLYFLLSRQR